MIKGIVRDIIQPVVGRVLNHSSSSSSSWTPQTEYLIVKAAMTTEPSLEDQVIQDAWVKGLKTLGVWDKLIVADNFACPDVQSSLLNWKSPGTFNPSKNITSEDLIHTVHEAFKSSGAGKNDLSLNFIPSSDGAGFLGQNDMTVIVGIATDDLIGSDDRDFGAGNISVGSKGSDNLTTLAQLNGAEVGFGSTITKRYITISRNNGTLLEVFKNLSQRIHSNNSTELGTNNLYACGMWAWGGSNKKESFVLIFKYLIPTEVRGVIKACEDYLTHYGTNIITYQKKVFLNMIYEGHSFNVIDAPVMVSIQATVNELTWYASAVAGSPIANVISRAATVDSKLIVETSTYKNILALWIGVNDIIHTAGQGLTAYNALKPYVQARVTAGHRVFVYTVIACDNADRTGAYHAQFEIERNVYNNALRTDLSLISNVYILDTDTIPELSEGTADYANCYNVDKLHPSATGGRLAAGLFSAKIEELYG